ncbi:type IV toxin-antitoxin system AbiEi family antitoxin domain-containing protein [Nocardioides guangzhouensis]|uniref:type IV toxin-antitoxin system AbiEi family antitoxin domain-containing protein n=1 Tax=Nocardioides guangzhouensis TaxID=2497878 RepID=UPI001C379025|nr:type IV toxin-antitoxin system AbiEi family antitoxin domain-containing protein [Nocardioides guangzhouensis]
MRPEIVELLASQDQVVRRAQLLEAGLDPNDVRRLLRRRDLSAVHPGVYAGHNGPLSWQQRAWAAVLHAWPAALSHDSALHAAGGPGRRDRIDQAPLHIAVDRGRSSTSPLPGVVTHHLAGLQRKALWNVGPPRLRIEEALVDVAAGAATDFDAIATLADAVQARRTTAPRIRAALDERSRVARRAFLVGILTDLAEGTCSSTGTSCASSARTVCPGPGGR